jgi:hypothetical protein
MSITYESDGVTWECIFEFNYDIGDESVFVKKSGRRI